MTSELEPVDLDSTQICSSRADLESLLRTTPLVDWDPLTFTLRKPRGPHL